MLSRSAPSPCPVFHRGPYAVLLLVLACLLAPIFAPMWAVAETPYMPPVEALYLAVIMNDLDEAARVLDQGQDPNQADPEGDGCTVLTYVGSMDMLALLLEHGADPNQVCPDGLTSLHQATSWPHGHRAIPLILEHGGLVNARYQGDTPLHWSVTAWIEHSSSDRPHADGAIITELVLAGADLDALDSLGMTPLMVAAQNGRPELARMLLHLGADPSVRDENGLTALDMARALGDQEMAEALSQTP